MTTAILNGKRLAFKATELRHARASNDCRQIVADMLGANDDPLFGRPPPGAA